MQKTTYFIKVMLIFIFISRVSFAQDTCDAIVQQAIQTAATNCDGLRRNQACYGNVTINAEAAPDVEDFTFDNAGDIANVSDIASMRLSSQVGDSGEWGISMMYVQANLADDISENVQIVLFGDVELDNAGFDGNVQLIEPFTIASSDAGSEGQAESVDEEATPEPVTIEITSTTNLNVRGGASTNAAIVGTLANGENSIADARNEAGDWLHITLADGVSGWVFAPLVVVDGDVFTLEIALENTGSAENISTNESSSLTSTYPEAVFLSGNDQIEGVFEATDSTKYYIFTAEAGQRLSATARSLDESLPVHFSIFNANMDYVVGSTGVPARVAQLVDYQIEESGEYILFLSDDYESEQVQEFEFEFYLSSPASYGPTNAFYFDLQDNTVPACGDRPESGILVQTPEGIGQISILINEVQIDLGSTAFIQTTSNEMSVGILEGGGNIMTPAGTITAIPGTLARVTFAGDSVTDGVSDIEVDLLDDDIVTLLPTELLDRQFTYRSEVIDLCAEGGFVWNTSGSEYTADEFRAVGRSLNYFVAAGQTITLRNEGGTLLDPPVYAYARLASVTIEDGEITTQRDPYLADSGSSRDLIFTPQENVLFQVEFALTRNDGEAIFTATCS